jgi:hypothetical protein
VVPAFSGGDVAARHAGNQQLQVRTRPRSVGHGQGFGAPGMLRPSEWGAPLRDDRRGRPFRARRNTATTVQRQ